VRLGAISAHAAGAGPGALRRPAPVRNALRTGVGRDRRPDGRRDDGCAPAAAALGRTRDRPGGRCGSVCPAGHRARLLALAGGGAAGGEHPLPGPRLRGWAVDAPGAAAVHRRLRLSARPDASVRGRALGFRAGPALATGPWSLLHAWSAAFGLLAGWGY